MQTKKQQLEWDMDQNTGWKLGKEYIKAVYCHSAYLTYMQSAMLCLVTQLCPTLCNPMDCSLPGSIMWNADLDDTEAGIKIAKRNTNYLRYAHWITVMAENEEDLKSLDGGEREEWKSYLNTQH